MTRLLSARLLSARLFFRSSARTLRILTEMRLLFPPRNTRLMETLIYKIVEAIFVKVDTDKVGAKNAAKIRAMETGLVVKSL